MRGFGWGCPNVHFVCHVSYKIVYAHLCDIHLVSSVMHIHLRPAWIATSLGLVLIYSVDIVVWKIPWSKKIYLASYPNDHAHFLSRIVFGKIFGFHILADIIMMGIKIWVLETAELIPGLSFIPVSIGFLVIFASIGKS